MDTKSGLVTKFSTRTSLLLQRVKPRTISVNLTVLPAFVDAHTRILLHPYAETSAINQIRDESAMEGIVRATNHCRAALLAGDTTYRDLGAEAFSHADKRAS